MSGQPVRGIASQQRVVSRFSPQTTERLARGRGRLAAEPQPVVAQDTQEPTDRVRAEKLVVVPSQSGAHRLPEPTPQNRIPAMRQRPRTPLNGRLPGAGPDTPADAARTPQAWNLGITGRLLLADLMRDLTFTRAEAERVVTLPIHKLERTEVAKLSNEPVSAETRARIVRELGRVAVALERRGDPQLGAIALTMAEQLPRTVDAYAVKMLWDLSNRLPRAEDSQLGAAHFHAPEVSTTGENDQIREAIFSFGHDGANTSGYKFYFSSTPPSGAEFVADYEIDVGYIHPSATGERKYHFEDADNHLNNGARYYVWATAYNEEFESDPSNTVHESFPSATRGDLNRDGVIDTADMDALMRILLGEADTMALADVNADGWVTQADVEALIAKMS